MNGKRRRKQKRITFDELKQIKPAWIISMSVFYFVGGFIMDNVKIGARNSVDDEKRLQAIHDLAIENGAICGGNISDGKSFDPNNILVMMVEKSRL